MVRSRSLRSCARVMSALKQTGSAGALCAALSIGEQRTAFSSVNARSVVLSSVGCEGVSGRALVAPGGDICREEKRGGGGPGTGATRGGGGGQRGADGTRARFAHMRAGSRLGVRGLGVRGKG